MDAQSHKPALDRASRRLGWSVVLLHSVNSQPRSVRTVEFGCKKRSNIRTTNSHSLSRVRLTRQSADRLLGEGIARFSSSIKARLSSQGLGVILVASCRTKASPKSGR